MAKGFHDIIKKEFGSSNYAGDQYGGATGASGRGLPDGHPGNFIFATGIECSNPTINNGKIRRDQLEECGHYTHWRKDLKLVKELGLKFLRYGLPYYKIHTAPGKYDWSFPDEVLNEMRKLELTPILDLMHFGLPGWLENYQNPEFPVHFAHYAKEVAKRYPWVRYYTPVNEIYVTARMSAKEGLWNEQLKTDKAFVTAIKHAVAASILATHGIAQCRPNAIIIQSETAEYIHEAKSDQSDEIRLQNKQRLIALDLLFGYPPDADVCMYLMDNGLTRKEYNWFMMGEPPGYQIMGNDYYGRNEKILKPDGSYVIAEDVMGWYHITHDYYKRYKKPVMHTETNIFDPDYAPTWLWKQWVNILRMRADGVPVLGFTWYSLTDQVDWDCGLAEKNGNVNACGLYDLNRHQRPVAAAYRMLLEEFGHITLVPHGEIFEITNREARLKIDV